MADRAATATARKLAGIITEADLCQDNFPRFARAHCQILQGDGETAAWGPFALWPAQEDAARMMQARRLITVLKARQLGLTWLSLAFALWHLIFHPVATVLLFSRRDKEASDLLARLRGMARRLPDWLLPGDADPDNGHEWRLPSGSRALAFPTTAGDSYTATLAVVDEADLIPDLDQLLRAVKPTTDDGGRLLLVSRADKSRPESPFKRIYLAARAGQNDWSALFLPWKAHPKRDEAWYEAQKRDVFSRTGSLDDLHEQYPSTDVEALSPRTLDKRIPSDWLRAVYAEQAPLPSYALPSGVPAIPGLAVYAPPANGCRYVVGADPAEGNPTSDDSALAVLDVHTGEEVATLAGKIQPEVLGHYAAQVARWYNFAPVMVERNNHGHLTLASARDRGARLLDGLDNRPGWLASTLGNATLYDRCAEAVRNGEVRIHNLTTFTQLASIDGNTLAAPPGQHDDRCLAAGTLIETLSGRVPIEAVVPGQSVLTRQGYRRVLCAGMTHPNEPIWEVVLANGSVLRGTADHPVWVCSFGFVTIDGLALMHRMLSCESKPWNSTALCSGVTLTPNGGHTEFTTLLTHPIANRLYGCTARSGRRPTGRSPKGTSSTMRTATHSTTHPTTWSACQGPITRGNTRSGATTPAPETEKSWTPSGRLLQPGTPLSRDLPGTARMASGPGRNGNPLHWSAQSVGPLLLACAASGGRGFVPLPVSSVRPTGASGPVFNLKVEGAAEFFASGVLVHNSDAFALANAGRPRANPAAPGPQPRAGVSAVERLRKLRNA